MPTIRERLDEDPFALHLNIQLLELGEGHARARMALGPFHRNAFGMVHGGAIFGLADCAFQAASNSHGVLAVAVQANIAYVKAPAGEALLAEATEISRTKRLANYSIRVTEEGGGLVALFQGFVYRMPDKRTPGG
ncbi:MAG: PaaI family thioesterase [bacterium]